MLTSIFKLISRSAFAILVVMVSVNYMPDSMFKDFPLEPNTVQPNDYDSVIPQNWNTKLSDGQPEFIQLNNILGPESLALSKSGLIYTGLADGRLVELDPANNYKLRTVIRPPPKCPKNVATRADECGRFLQLRFSNETLYAIDAMSGLYKIDTKTGSKTSLGPKPLTPVELYNSFSVDPVDPNLVYVSVSSTRWSVLNIVWGFMEQDSSGRLVMLDIKSGKRVVVLDGLRMSNGVETDTKRDQLLMSEILKSSITSVPLAQLRTAFKSARDGDKLKNVDSKTLIPLLPGHPDNIIVAGDLAYIALPFIKINGKELVDQLGTMPQIRKSLSRFSFGLGKILEYACNNLYYHPLLEKAYRELKCGHVFYRITQTDKSAVVEYNLATGATRLFGSDTFGFVSEAVPDGKGNLLLGSFRSPFIVKQKGLGV